MAHEFKEVTECWQCGHPSERSLFCQYCDSLQRPTLDYYKFFGMEPKLGIEPSALQKRFYKLSRLLHPDRYTHKTVTERQYSLEATAILNNAYRVLRDPVSRAEYYLKQSGLPPGEERSKNVPPELLEEVFELNMALEELRGGDQSVRPQLERARSKFLPMREELDRRLEEVFRKHDSTRDRSVLSEIRTLLDHRRYIHNLVSEVERGLAV